MSRGDYCTYCGMAGHRASQCPARVLTPSLARLLGAWGKKARRLVCARGPAEMTTVGSVHFRQREGAHDRLVRDSRRGLQRLPKSQAPTACGMHDMNQHTNDRTESDQHGSNKTEPASASPSQPQGETIAKAIHYPECWDTAAYPTVESALAEVAATFRCTNQDTHAQPQGEQSTAPESPQAAAQSTALEPVAWRFRWGVGNRWSNWRDDKAELSRWQREGRDIEYAYATPSAAMALLGEAREALDEAMNYTASAAFSPSMTREIGNLIARIDALTGTGRKEQSQ